MPHRLERPETFRLRVIMTAMEKPILPSGDQPTDFGIYSEVKADILLFSLI